ncbi:uncharacterized protein O3C94_012855 [Discoglossus pictus]
MKTAVSYCSLLLLTMLFCGIDSGHGMEYMESPARNPEPLILQARDEEPQYPDVNYDSGEQDRWPTLEELARYSSKRMHYGKRASFKTPALDAAKEEDKDHDLRRHNVEKSLYDLLSAKSQLPPDRRNMEDLRDLYLAADLIKRHRLPRDTANPTNQN